MIHLVKGDENKLEGKVIAYSKFTGDMSEFLSPKALEKILSKGISKGELNEKGRGSLFAMYSSPDLQDIIKKSGAPREYEEFIQNKVEGAFKKMPRKKFRINVFTTTISSFSEEDIPILPEDVIYTGSWAHPARCTESIFSALTFYNLIYTEQRDNKIKSIHENTIRTGSFENYRAVPKDSLGKYIMQNYIGFMMDANKNGELNEFSKLQARFLKFSEGSHFMGDAMNICKSLNTGRDKAPDLRLIEAYIGKIQAIEMERYEEAAKYRDTIKSLTF